MRLINKHKEKGLVKLKQKTIDFWEDLIGLNILVIFPGLDQPILITILDVSESGNIKFKIPIQEFWGYIDVSDVLAIISRDDGTDLPLTIADEQIGWRPKREKAIKLKRCKSKIVVGL